TRELCARDIAVLVDSNREAASMQRALARAGVPAASCLRASVYASEEAADLRLLLEALRDPADAPHARTARASLLVGDDASAIARTSTDSAALDPLLTETAEWATWAARRGPLPLLHRLIARAAPRLLAMSGGDRRVANYLQLAELLQEDFATCFGMDDLCERYAQALRERAGDTDADAVRLRLDTDAQAVQIATVHAAKGLEYGVVLLPCAASGHAPGKNGKRPALTWYHDGDSACVALGNDIAAETGSGAQREALAEEVRKFYVGITRARAACVMPWGFIKHADATALHWLLHTAGREAPLGFDEAACKQALAELVARGDGQVAVSQLPAASAERLSKPEAGPTCTAAAEFRGSIERDWKTWSFSRLVRGQARGEVADPGPGHGDAAPTGEAQNGPTLAGARFGSAVHAALEHADFAAWRDANGIPETQRSLVVRSLRAQGLPEPRTVSIERAMAQVGECMRGALNVRLECGARLCDVEAPRRRAEMEFHLRLAPSSVDALFALLHAHGYQRERAGVGTTRLHGMLTGLMDLVFEHGGRYHLIDYKTNLLPAYTADALHAAIATHDYDLQYLLYVLALHRWLRRVLPGYAYETHMGDLYYLFVRGIVLAPETSVQDLSRHPESGTGLDPASPHQMHGTEARLMRGEPSVARIFQSGVHRDRPPRELVEAMDALFQGDVEAAA
ncbi:MAG: 3'-5' exonuclease, partial [Rhodanobacteraceae bacterium]